MRARRAASMTEAAVSTKGPAQLITSEQSVRAPSRDGASSTEATLTSNEGCAFARRESFSGSLPTRTAEMPRRSNSETTNRPVWPDAPKTPILGSRLVNDIRLLFEFDIGTFFLLQITSKESFTL